MSASITYPTLQITLQKLYFQYAKKHGLKAVPNNYTLFNRFKSFGQKYFGSGQLINAGEGNIDDENSDVLDPEVFLFKCIELLEEYFKPISELNSFDTQPLKGVDVKRFSDVHELWEYESNKKIKELMKINSFANENKHLRLFDLMAGSVKTGELTGAPSTSYFSSFLNKVKEQTGTDGEKKSEADKFIEEYTDITNDMRFNGMPLSLNEKITVLNSKTAQLIGLYTTLKKKQEE